MSEKIVDWTAYRRAANVIRSQKVDLEFSGGGGDSGGMEARFARIESDVKELKQDVKGATARLASVEGKLDLLTTQIIGKIPTGWTFFGVIFGTLIAVPTVLGALVWVARYFEIIPKP